MWCMSYELMSHVNLKVVNAGVCSSRDVRLVRTEFATGQEIVMSRRVDLVGELERWKFLQCPI